MVARGKGKRVAYHENAGRFQTWHCETILNRTWHDHRYRRLSVKYTKNQLSHEWLARMLAWSTLHPIREAQFSLGISGSALKGRLRWA